MYRIILEKKVQKFLKNHKWEKFIQDFENTLNILAIDPYENKLDIKSLVWLSSSYRIRIGKYRFLYEIKDKEIIIIFFGAWSRGDIYK